MGKRRGWIVLILLVAVAGLLALRPWSTPLPTVRFPDGRSSRILKISFGTNHVLSLEPFWKRAVRAALPATLEKHLGAAKESRSTTEYDSLAIYLQPLEASPMRAEVVFPDGTAFTSRWIARVKNPIVFENYPRGERTLLIRFWELGGLEPLLNIEVPNPRRATKSLWTARTLPQTNHVPGTEVILKGCSRSLMCIIPRSIVGGKVGWMQWHTWVLDPWGNWKLNTYYEDSQFRYHQDQFPGAKSERVFKFVAEGREYLSAAFVELPACERYLVLPVSARITNWGVRLLVLFGPGRYEVTKDLSVKTAKSGSLQTNAVQLIGSSWLIQCAEPAVFCVSEKPSVQARLRERLYDGGRIFSTRRQRQAMQRGMEAQLFTPRLPTVTTNLEVEVIVRWPAAEFIIEKPQ